MRSPLFLALLLPVGCNGNAGGPVPDPTVATAAPIVLTDVRLPPLQLGQRFARDAEFRGLITVAIELGLADIPGVVPLVAGDGLPVAFRGERAPAARQVDARLSASGRPDSLELELELCVAGGECASTVATATSKAPWAAVGALLEGAAAALDVPIDDATRAAWTRPGSKDDYAELITGRAGAQFLGILPPTLTPGDRKADPVRRALVLDPEQPLAQWIHARWEIATTVDGGKAAVALTRAQLSRPTSPLLAADQAALLSLTGHVGEALLAWETLAATAPGDPRWILPLARARLAAGQGQGAVAALEALPTAFTWDPAVAALRVAATEAAGDAEALDPLLARWQAVASHTPEPVRRRIDLRVKWGAYADAETLMGALRERDPGPPTDALEVALLLTMRRFEDAAGLAPVAVASRIRARARLETAPGVVPEMLDADDARRPAVEAEAALWLKDGATALAAADRAVAGAPDRAEPYALRARALEALGRGNDASAAWVRAWDLDPGQAGGPVEARRIASTFRYVEAGEPVDEGAPDGLPGPQGPEI
ncbi:MAG: hypothetical protein EXR71_18475 [Myxococcales bacterium]|nr:hypothetical protein [Myxococcales bacterium]